MQVFEWAFGKRETPAERLRKYQRTLERTQRELDRERGRLESQERKLIGDIKKAAREDHMSSVQIMAKDLVRTRQYIQKFYRMKVQLQAVALRIQTVRGNQQMMGSMQGAARLMSTMNRSMNLPALSRIAMEFERETDMMDQREEMMDDAIDGIEDEEAGEEEQDEIISKVLDEIGIDLKQQLSDAPTAQPANATEARVDDLSNLEARLDSLKRT